MSVRKRNNRWHVDTYDSNGNRVRKAVRIKGIDPDNITKQLALNYEKILKGKLAEGIELPSNRREISFEKLVSEYLDWCDDNHKRADRDHTACKQLLTFFKGYKSSNINLWLVESYKKRRKEEGKKPRTINIELATLRHMYNKAIEWQLLGKNPINGIKLLKEEVKAVRVLEDWEFQELYSSANDSFKNILLFAYFTGCRKSEIQYLKWENVNFDAGNVIITKAKNYEEREVDLNSILLNLLKKLKKSSTSDYVFTFRDKPYTSRSGWKTSWNTALKKSGIKHCTFHDLRHTFVSNLMVNERVDFETVSHYLC